MKVIKSISEMSAWSRRAQKKNETIAFVPTLGALHDGHLSLARRAREAGDRVIVSIFVNPLQFGQNEDFHRYPRTVARDLELLKSLNVDVVFIPKISDMYAEGFQTSVYVKNISRNLCGQSRPGHFEGVATVVLKLLNIIKANVAIFGDKDYQQRLVIERMVRDLNIDTKIVAVPIIREGDGLAMSSRNRYLSPSQRKQALVLRRSLKVAEKLFLEGERQAAGIIRRILEMIDKERAIKVDYIKICDAKTLEEVVVVKRESLVALAVYLGDVRLIDNIILNSSCD